MKHYISILHKRIISIICCCFLLGSASLMAQVGRSITGTVVDDLGEELIGVSVIEEGTTNGTMTDLDGGFKLTLTKEHGKIVFSYLGFRSQTIKVGPEAILKVQMAPDAVHLKELIVTGYGGQVSRNKLTTSISKVSTEHLESGVKPNPLTALAGTVTGVRVTQASGQPGTAPQIQVRGGASLNGSGSPLYIVDGMQRDNLNDLNTDDIESIEILKDAGATAIYGARANNGVVLITSKKGKVGRAVINFKANVGRNYDRNTNKFLNAHDFLYWTRVGAQRSNMTGLLTAAGPFGTGNDLTADGNLSAAGKYSTMYRSAVDNTTWNRLQKEGWQMMVDPVWDGADASKEYLIYKGFNIKDASMQEAWTQNYNLSLEGGNEQGKYYASLAYYTEDGLPLNTSFDRLSFNLNGDYKIKPWLSSNAFVRFTNSKSNKNPIGGSNFDKNFFGRTLSTPPTLREYNNDGELIATAGNYTDGNLAAQSHLFYRRDESFNIMLGTSMKFDFSKHLDLTAKAIWDLRFRERESFNKRFLSSAGVYDEVRAASANSDRVTNKNYSAILNYRNSWDKHSVSALGGAEFIENFNYGFAGSGQGATSDDFINLQYTEIINADGTIGRSLTTEHIKERIMSGVLNINYDYDERYLASFSARLDGHSKLVDNKWGVFPGGSVAWNIHREKFMEDYHFIDNLKLRSGVGLNGNVNNIRSAYALQGLYKRPGNYKGEYGFLINDIPYPKMRWEKTLSFDLALEYGFLNRVHGTIGVYNKRTTDLITSVPFPTSAGVGNMLTNNGSVNTKGFEMDLTWAIIDKKDFKWNFGINVTYQRSKVISLPNNGNEKNRQNGQQVWNPATGELMWVGGHQEGQEYGAIYTYNAKHIVKNEADLQNYQEYVDLYPKNPIYGPAAYERLTDAEKSKAQELAPGDVIWEDVNGDNVIDAYDQVKVGNLVPRVLGGFNTSIKWNRVSFYARFDYAAGYKQFNNRLSWYLGMKQGTYNTVEEVWKTWSPNNMDAKYPIYQYADQNYKQNYRASSLFYEDSKYLSAREMTVSYEFPRTLIEKAKCLVLK